MRSGCLERGLVAGVIGAAAVVGVMTTHENLSSAQTPEPTPTSKDFFQTVVQVPLLPPLPSVIDRHNPPVPAQIPETNSKTLWLGGVLAFAGLMAHRYFRNHH